MVSCLVGEKKGSLGGDFQKDERTRRKAVVVVVVVEDGRRRRKEVKHKPLCFGCLRDRKKKRNGETTAKEREKKKFFYLVLGQPMGFFSLGLVEF